MRLAVFHSGSGMGGMHALIGIALAPLAIAVVGDIGIDVLLGQGLEVGFRMVARIGGDHGIGAAQCCAGLDRR